jgi:tRNA nucleotidyltransferase (CCA-adding enzyme)
MKSLKNFYQTHPHWTTVQSVCETLKKNGHEAWLAGGCVRDALLGRTPQDFDVATSASPDQVENLFEKSVAVGKSFGVIVLPFEGFQIEVATFRKDGLYVDGRRPTEVIFSSPEEDASRRDFTVNALFYDLSQDRVVDFVEGLKDLDLKLIRTVGVARDRFEEDQLRLLRAVRFAAQLGFEIEAETLKAVTDLSSKISRVSKERIRDEVLKLLKSQEPVRGLRWMAETGLFRELFPLLDAAAVTADFKLFEKAKSKASTPLLLSIFFRNFKGPLEPILMDLRLSKNEIRAIEKILKARNEIPKLRLAAKLRLKSDPVAQDLDQFLKVFHPEFKDYLDLPIAKLPAPWMDGQKAQALGIRPGPKMGKLLKEVYDLQLEGQIKNPKAAEEWLKKTLKGV